LFGLPANFPEIDLVAKKYKIRILEDAAQGFGGNINGKPACSFGDAATTSFFPAKPLGCYGDGGAIFTDNDDEATLLRSIKFHGKGSNKYDNLRIGVNSRLDTIQAAVLLVKLKALDEHELSDVNRIFTLYNSKLRGKLEIPLIPKGYYSSFAQYTIKLKNKVQRDGLQAYLKRNGIPSMVYYYKSMHKQVAFSFLLYDENDFVVSNQLVDTVLSLPMHPYLKEEDVFSVCSHILKFLSENT